MRIYANEIDPVACAVLRATLPGAHVDERSIKDVRPEDLIGFGRAHFFAGAGLWDVACELAGWRRPIWTASCPCQPFSVAGKGAGEDDPRHLWPDLFRLVRECRPGVVVGEQVGGAAGDAWLDRVGADLESENFTFWAAEAPASSVNAPHQRLRNFWVAVGNSSKLQRQRNEYQNGSGGKRPYDANDAIVMANARSGSVWSGESSEDIGSSRSAREEAWQQRFRPDNRASNDTERMADADSRRCDRRQEDAERLAQRRDAAERPHEQLLTECEYYGSCTTPDNCALPGICERGPWRRRWEWDDIADEVVEHAESERRGKGRPEHELRGGRHAAAGADGPGVDVADTCGTRLEGQRQRIPDASQHSINSIDNGSFWNDAEWLVCADGKARRAKPGIRLLVNGMVGRADLWRLAGNSIVPQLAAEVLGALQDELDERERSVRLSEDLFG